MFIDPKPETGRILSQRTVYSGPVFDLKQLTVQTPDGLQVERDLIKHAQAVAILALTKDNQVLVGREYRVGVNREAYSLPAGLMNPTETALEAAKRELQEETGYQPTHLEEMVAIHSSEGMTDEFVHLMLARIDAAPSTQPDFDHDEFVTSQLVPLDEVIAAVKTGAITSAQSVAALSYYLAFHQAN